MGCIHKGMAAAEDVQHKEGCKLCKDVSGGVKSRCGGCGECYYEKVGGGNGCMRCGQKLVTDVVPSRGCLKWEEEVLDAYGVGHGAFVEIRRVWTASPPHPRTPPHDPTLYEESVTNWLAAGGREEALPRGRPVPLSVTVTALQHLATWQPIGKLD
eukprot:TRINITY_DN7575_c0_g1_i1.p1 TRINITY_DN7575_c0_g1~~TRINITY_DN7575_c0_g1_i1.p1  ORF type:complete len:156 (+),score=14.16 TRINITY_DN7575_c0_g1_i1:43-510(+)